MKNYFKTPCGTLEINMFDHKMVAIVYDNHPYYRDLIQQPVKIYRGLIKNYMGEAGNIVRGWCSAPCYPKHSIEMMKDADSVFYSENIHKIYDLKSGQRIF